MSKLAIATAALAFTALPAFAQSDTPTPLKPNSGAGTAGHPGHQSGPAPKSGAETTGAASPRSQNGKPAQDTSQVPGLPGGKSGPTVKSPSKPEK